MSRKKPRRFANGTSFAAPIVAGIASQVVRALKDGGAFRGLKPRSRIALVNRIIKASERNGSVNGLRAVAIAERWNRRGGMMGVGQLAQLLSQEPDRVCDQSEQRCDALRVCADVKQCFETSKQRAALCPYFSASEAASAAKTAFKHGNREAGLGFARLAGSDPETAKAALEAYLKQVKSPRKIDVSGLQQVVLPYLESCSRTRTCDAALVRRALDGAQNSPKINASARRAIDKRTGEDRGGRATVAALARALALSGEMVPRLAAMAMNRSSRATAARVIDSLLSDSSTTPALAASLRDIESTMRADLAGKKEWMLGSTAAFDRMIERNIAALNRAVATGNLGGLSALEVRYILRNLNRYSDWRRRKDVIVRNVLYRIARGQGWGKLNDSVLRRLAQNGSWIRSRYPRPIAAADPE